MSPSITMSMYPIMTNNFIILNNFNMMLGGQMNFNNNENVGSTIFQYIMDNMIIFPSIYIPTESVERIIIVLFLHFILSEYYLMCLLIDDLASL